LVDPLFIRYLYSHNVRAYLREHRADYLISPGGFEPYLGFPDPSPPQLSKLAEFCTPEETWFIGNLYTNHALRCQIIYKIPSGP
jgi:hypothetical protein